MRRLYNALRDTVQQHRKEWKHANHATHLAYFGMVASHGAYHYAALALLVLGIVLWLGGAEE